MVSVSLFNLVRFPRHSEILDYRGIRCTYLIQALNAICNSFFEMLSGGTRVGIIHKHGHTKRCH